MKAFIRATGNISPQKTFGHPAFLPEAVAYERNRLSCIEPDYKHVLDPKYLRRMSRIIRMGAAAAMECLREGGITKPGAIITGTAYGCLEDTGMFLSKLVEQQEDMLTPTAFIQSTHNTVGAQIALVLGCREYNNTYVHRGFSFESALLDALMYLEEGEATDVLTGSVDEITDASHAILSRFDLYKKDPVSNLGILPATGKGTIAGEGATFFLMSAEPGDADYAVLEGLHTFYKPGNQQVIENEIVSFLRLHDCMPADIDLVITGRNGDARGDVVYDQLTKTIFHGKEQAQFKHLCGEYPTASSFACWLAANILKTGTIPAAMQQTGIASAPAKKILVYNHSNQIHHSLILLAAC